MLLGRPSWGDEFRGPLRSEVPVLILAGNLDSRTPVRNARELMQHLPNAHLIEVENAGHDLNWMQPELRSAWRDFLAGATVKITHAVAPKPQFAVR